VDQLSRLLLSSFRDGETAGGAWYRQGRAIDFLLSASRIALAVLFVVAASLKLKLLLDVVVQANPSHVNWLGELASFSVAGYELLLGIWLVHSFLVNLRPYVVALTFVVYAIYVASQLYRGATTCDCLGTFSLSLQTMLIVDTAAVLVSFVDFFFCKEPKTGARTPLRPAMAVFLGAPAITIVLASLIYLMAFERSPNASGAFDADQSRIELIPGRSFPIATLDSSPQSLTEGDWIIVFHRPGCQACDKTLAKLQSSGPSLIGASRTCNILLVNTTPATSLLPPSFLDTLAPRVQMSSTRSFVSTPTVCHIRSGNVISVLGPLAF